MKTLWRRLVYLTLATVAGAVSGCLIPEHLLWPALTVNLILIIACVGFLLLGMGVRARRELP